MFLTFAGSHVQIWGVMNREAPLRLCTTPGVPSATNFELKVPRCSRASTLGFMAVTL